MHGARAGITSVHDAGAHPRPESYRAYEEVIAEGRMAVRVYLMVYDEYAL